MAAAGPARVASLKAGSAGAWAGVRPAALARERCGAGALTRRARRHGVSELLAVRAPVAGRRRGLPRLALERGGRPRTTAVRAGERPACPPARPFRRAALPCRSRPVPGRGTAMGLPGAASLLAALLLGAARGRALEVRAEPVARAFVGEAVVLRCWFRSSAPLTEKLTIDWTFRPLAGGASEPIFHYQSEAYPAREGTFRGRVSWAGDVAKQDASIAIASPTMDDNGTFACSVKNPPDVQHNIPETVLTVAPRGVSFQLTLAGLLSMLVFLPSAVVVALLLVRMGRKSGALSGRKKFACKKSSIEVVDEPEHPSCMARLAGSCVQCLDTDEEDPY